MKLFDFSPDRLSRLFDHFTKLKSLLGDLEEKKYSSKSKTASSLKKSGTVDV